jgi:hypothetical protein
LYRPWPPLSQIDDADLNVWLGSDNNWAVCAQADKLGGADRSEPERANLPYAGYALAQAFAPTSIRRAGHDPETILTLLPPATTTTPSHMVEPNALAATKTLAIAQSSQA